ncbi:DUF4468 domain-containing protein [Palleniella muris]|uniref:DUF4468 domain-containing protein n=1 Tax=Palleniella muris TaxID=3038145 RepID=A0AC61QPQ7_9BACT|nr:DUF4468 domain-containing protein [Palleniella muris]TGX81849.1 DUF4468 domain-containing protein [Palleniella muris]
MKKLIILAIASLPLSSMAQSEWELPEDTQVENTKNSKRKKQKEQKNTTAISAHKETKQAISKIDPKYAAGKVPEVNGKVEWDKTITVPGVSADELYDRALNAIQSLTKDSLQSDSRIAAVNKREHIIAAKLDEEMVFSSSFISKDFTQFRYTLIANCKNGAVDIRLCRISYEYKTDKKEIYTAEEWITDSKAINKKGTRLYPLSGKFRRKTIDRVEEIFNYLSRISKQ